MATLSEIRAKLKEAEQRNTENSSPRQLDTSVYPFWNIKDGGEAVFRFLPDGNSANTFFWVERQMIKLTFAGIKGQADSREVTVQVPCVEMYNDGSVCPILSEVRAWFKDPALEQMGRKYWKKKSFIFQGLVVEDGLKEQEKPENPIRRFIIGPQIFTLIRAALVDPDLEDLPTDYVSGLDFRLKRGNKGGFADYSMSNWSRKTRPLSDTEMGQIEEYKLYNLSDFLPKKPGEIELQVIKEMFEASVDGEAYDPDRWSQYYRPSGLNFSDSKSTQPQPTHTSSVVSSVVADDNDDLPWKDTVESPSVSNTGSDKAAEILAKIRNRSSQ